MNLVFGGAYQGKLSWAVKAYGLKQEDLFDCGDGLPSVPAACLYHLEEFSLRCLRAGKNPVEELENCRDLWENGVLVCRDIGSGVVPIDPLERAWREENGKMLRYLASQADRVSRIFCGLEERLK